MRNLHPEQFHEQLRMFVPTQEIIDTMDKADSPLAYPYGHASPREQWEHPESGMTRERSLRDEKLADIDQGGYKESFDKAPPVALFHGQSSGRPKLADGHHRLAHAERSGIQYMAVEHYFPKSMR